MKRLLGEKMENRNKRIFMAFAGVCICGFSVGLFKMSMFGTDPFQCFANGVWNVVGISFGTMYTIINLLMLVVIFLLDRHYIGIATFINIFGTGYIVQFTTEFLSRYFSHADLKVRIILLLLGIVIMCFSSSLYYTADLGVSTYDAIALILANKKIAKFQYCRIGTDLICVIIGLLLHAVVGIGTVITAFFMGPLIEFFNVHIARPFLAGKKAVRA
jgi:Predicted membrane protein